jgi:hypothetical protein
MNWVIPRKYLVPLFAMAVGCGSTNVRSIVLNSQVTVVVTHIQAEGPAPARIDPTDPRIAVSARAVADLLGHPVTFEIDGALVPQFGASLHERFISAFETTASSLAWGKKNLPEAYAYASPFLRTIAFVYSPIEDRAAASLEPQTGTLRVVVRPSASSLLPGPSLNDAFERAFRDHEIAAYANLAPERVPLAEQRAYFHFVEGYRPPPTGKESSAPSENRDRIAAILALAVLTRDESLRAEIDHWLASACDTVARLGKAHDEEPAPADRAVLATYVAWLNARIDGLELRDRYHIVELVFGPGRGLREIRQGFDMLRFGAHAVDTFMPKSRPDELANHVDEGAIADLVVCPYRRDPSSRTVSSRPYCNGAFYIDVMALPNGAKKLADVLLRKRSDASAEAAVLNLFEKKGADAATALLQALEPNEGLSMVAVRALADDVAFQAPSSSVETRRQATAQLFGWAVRDWRTYPRRRAALLYLMTEIGRRNEGLIAWSDLAQVLGAPLGEVELAAFLDESPRALESLDLVGQGLGDGFSRANVVDPRFDRWLDDTSERNRGGFGPMQMVDRIVEVFCSRETLLDVAALQAFLRKRLELHPSERGTFQAIVEEKSVNLCPSDSIAARRAPGPSNPPKGVLFGD